MTIGAGVCAIADDMVTTPKPIAARVNNSFTIRFIALSLMVKIDFIVLGRR